MPAAAFAAIIVARLARDHIRTPSISQDRQQISTGPQMIGLNIYRPLLDCSLHLCIPSPAWSACRQDKRAAEGSHDDFYYIWDWHYVMDIQNVARAVGCSPPALTPLSHTRRCAPRRAQVRHPRARRALDAAHVLAAREPRFPTRLHLFRNCSFRRASDHWWGSRRRVGLDAPLFRSDG